MTRTALPPDAPPSAPPDALTRLTLLLLAALTIMAGATIAPALPAIQVHFADQPNAALLVKLALTIVGLAIAISAPIIGILADRFGRRPVLIGALLLYAVGGTSGLFISSLGELLTGRIILGLAVAGVMTASGALINDLFSGPARGKFLSQQAAFNNFGGAVLLPLGGLLAGVGWRGPFALYFVALLILPLVFRLPAGATAAAASTAPESKPAWAAIALIYVLALLYMIVFYLVPAQGPFLLRFLGAQPAATGLLLGVFTLMSAIISLTYSRFAGRFDPRKVVALGFGLLAGGEMIVSQATSIGGVIPGLMLAGGGGLVIPNLNAWLADITPARWRGRIVAGMSSSIFLGQFLSPLILAAPADQPAQGFVWGAVAAAVVSAVLLAFSCMRPKIGSLSPKAV
jgi:MFS family permease